MSPQPPITLAFDLYGTLLSTSSIAQALSKHFGDEKAASIATLWRRYQLEYTWRSNSMDTHIPFPTLTRRALSHALSEHSLSLASTDLDAMMDSYNHLSTFPNVDVALNTLSKAQEFELVIFSNGTQSMVESSIKNTPDLMQWKDVFKQIITVEEVGKYKPAREVYDHLAKKLGKEEEEDKRSIWLVSGNPFDIVGAKKAGLRAVWMDWEGKGWMDGLGEGEGWGGPDLVLRDLGDVCEVRKSMWGQRF